jgi:hypothetical protein
VLLRVVEQLLDGSARLEMRETPHIFQLRVALKPHVNFVRMSV